MRAARGHAYIESMAKAFALGSAKTWVQISRLPPALQAVLIAVAIEIPCAAYLERAGNGIHNAGEIILAILHVPTILFMAIIILPLKPYLVPEVLDSIWKIGAFLLQGMLIALVAFLILERRREQWQVRDHG